MKLTINRDRWITGRYLREDQGLVVDNPQVGHSSLLNRQGFSCCLGFYGKALGMEDHCLYNVLSPLSQKRRFPEAFGLWPAALMNQSCPVHHNGGFMNWQNVFIALNDELDVDDEIREDWIRYGFKVAFDVDVEFVGQYPEFDRGVCNFPQHSGIRTMDRKCCSPDC